MADINTVKNVAAETARKVVNEAVNVAPKAAASVENIIYQLKNMLINNPLGYALLPALFALVFIFISSVLMLLRSISNTDNNKDDTVVAVQGEGYQKIIICS